jgi:hypothetical protein
MAPSKVTRSNRNFPGAATDPTPHLCGWWTGYFGMFGSSPQMAELARCALAVPARLAAVNRREDSDFTSMLNL